MPVWDPEAAPRVCHWRSSVGNILMPWVGSGGNPTREEVSMYARAVRFTDVSPERIAAIQRRVEESGGPPPGVDSSGLKLLVDEDQGTAIFVGFFETEQKMRDASAVFDQMDASDTPGTRASVDLCEVKIDRSVS